ncbi:unnamed protein product [Anisakis simplex]|uniref:ECF transporter S component n=1 Tax=Anisakis simplex TaxID=6269 RepID=A0A0M3J4T3_ANISI|nr:unnamed protein product [Anisakis simplex]
MRKITREIPAGFFVQWVECSVVFLFGYVINVVRNFPPFQPIAIIGGFLFATGNVAAVPLINGLGMAPGMLIWGSTMVIGGWSAGRFGLFHTVPQRVVNEKMNVSGLILVLIRRVESIRRNFSTKAFFFGADSS